MTRINSKKIQFKGGLGFTLDARLDEPSIPPSSYAIFCHCFTCTKETLATYRISRFLAQQGIAVLRFDFTGLGQSGGQFEDTNFTTMISDIIAASDYLAEHYQAPTLLLGHSLGGTAVLAASIKLQTINNIVTIAAPSNPEHVVHHFGNALMDLEKDIPSSFTVAGVTFPIKPQFINDVRNLNTKKLFPNIDKPVLIFSALNDEIVGTHNAKELNEWVGGNSSVVTLATANHLISDVVDAQFITDQIIKWIDT